MCARPRLVWLALALVLALCAHPARPLAPAGSGARTSLEAAGEPQQAAAAERCPAAAAAGGELEPAATSGATSPLPAAGVAQTRASDFVKPNHYTLRLKLDPARRKFSGQLMVALDVAPAELQATLEGPEARVARDKHGHLGHRYLSLHAGSNLQIRKAFYVFSGRSSLQIAATRIGRDPERELLTLDFQPNVITAGPGLLLVVYSGSVNDSDSVGLFRHHSARSGPGSAAAGLATQLQPNFARRLLPAWDEPHLKARFALVVVLPSAPGYQVLSNMPVKRTSSSLSCSGERLQEVEFHTTPLMSSYLLALVVGRLEWLEASTASGTRLRLYVYANASSDQVNTKRLAAHWPLALAVATFERLESQLALKYPLPKFDMIALREFASGGMENWGASIFHERYLLYENTSLAPAGQQASQAASSDRLQVSGGEARAKRLIVPLVVAHEIAHQWFGNLLTSRSWTYLWLNEGFAQLLMYDVADALHPEELYWHIFVEDSRQLAMQADELLTSSRALEFDASNASASQQAMLFDPLTYNKGAMVVRMLHSILGADQFYAGLRHYLYKHSYAAVASDDLWQALDESTGRSEARHEQLGPLMARWLHHEGFPLVSVRVYELAAHFRLQLSQRRFTLLDARAHLAPANATSDDAHLTPLEAAAHPDGPWSIPVQLTSELYPREAPLSMSERVLRSANRSGLNFILRSREASLVVPKSQAGLWFKLNSNASGYFRVDYALPDDYQPESAADFRAAQAAKPVDMLARLVQPIKRHQLYVIDRYNILDDLFALVRAGRKSTSYFLRYLTDAFGNETEPEVLRPLVESLKRTKDVLVSNGDQRLNQLYDRFALQFLTRLASNLGPAPNSATAAGDSPSASRRHETEASDLLDTGRLFFNDPELAVKANNLFKLSFLQVSKMQFNSLGKDMRALVYISVLTGATDPDIAAGFRLDSELAGPGDPLMDEHSSPVITSVAPGNELANNNSNLSGTPATTPTAQQSAGSNLRPGDVFMTLLRAYSTCNSGSERAALSSALGSVVLPNKQAQLLNLTLHHSHFRPQDLAHLYESMARTSQGRTLLWQALMADTNLLALRQQAMGHLLRALHRGLVDAAAPPAPQVGQFEKELRALYRKYADSEVGKLLLQTIESLLINTSWFQRDAQTLAHYLESLNLE